MARTKAEFRAMRETLGLTQQTLANELDVKILSVKRWESPKYPQQAPDDVWSFLDDLDREQVATCSAALAKASQMPQDAIEVPYWSNAADYEEHRASDLTWTEANATSRRLAAILIDRGASVVWVDGATCDDPIV